VWEWLKKLRPRLEALIAEYGKVAILTYAVIFVLVIAGFAVAITLGVEVESAKGGAGVLVAAWAATKVTQPVRILAALALTPVVARVWKRLTGADRPLP
jgi:hypothetical protein